MRKHILVFAAMTGYQGSSRIRVAESLAVLRESNLK